MRKKQATTEPRRPRVLDDPKHAPQKGSSEYQMNPIRPSITLTHPQRKDPQLELLDL
jgi:hypothetical protein